MWPGVSAFGSSNGTGAGALKNAGFLLREYKGRLPAMRKNAVWLFFFFFFFTFPRIMDHSLQRSKQFSIPDTGMQAQLFNTRWLYCTKLIIVFGLEISIRNVIDHSNDWIQVTIRQWIGFERSYAHEHKRGDHNGKKNTFAFYLQFVRLYTKMEISQLTEYTASSRLLGIFGFHNRL